MSRLIIVCKVSFGRVRLTNSIRDNSKAYYFTSFYLTCLYAGQAQIFQR